MSRARNAKGESSIIRRNDGRWHGFVSMGLKDNGKRDRRHVSGKTRADVVAKVRALEAKRDAGMIAAAGRQGTVGQWLTHYVETIAAPRLRPSTLTRYRLAIRKQLIPKVGHHRLERLEPEHLEAAYAALRASGLAASTVLYAHRVLSSALKAAVRRGRIARNVASLVDPPTASTAEIVPLSLAEARAVLAAAGHRRNGARWSVGLALGMRQGEALGLTWQAVNLDDGTLRVDHALQRIPFRHGCEPQCPAPRPSLCARRELDLPPGFAVKRRLDGGMALVEPKSDAGKRTVALAAPLVDTLRAHRAAQLAERMAAANVWQDFGLVFTQPDGRPIGTNADRADWLAVLAAAGVRPARVHDARHTAATLLLVQGVSERVVMDLMGWSDQRMLLRYQHVIDELRRDAADRMSAALFGPLATKMAPSPGH